MSQIGDAVAQLDQLSRQNAALVEESAAAAQSLRVQADTLPLTLATFRLRAGPAAPASPSLPAARTPGCAARS